MINPQVLLRCPVDGEPRVLGSVQPPCGMIGPMAFASTSLAVEDTKGRGAYTYTLSKPRMKFRGRACLTAVKRELQ